MSFLTGPNPSPAGFFGSRDIDRGFLCVVVGYLRSKADWERVGSSSFVRRKKSEGLHTLLDDRGAVSGVLVVQSNECGRHRIIVDNPRVVRTRTHPRVRRLPVVVASSDRYRPKNKPKITPQRFATVSKMSTRCWTGHRRFPLHLACRKAAAINNNYNSTMMTTLPDEPRPI